MNQTLDPDAQREHPQPNYKLLLELCLELWLCYHLKQSNKHSNKLYCPYKQLCQVSL